MAKMMLTERAIRVLDPTQQPGWDQSIVGYPECTFFHSVAWAAVLSQSYGYQPLYLGTSSPAGPLFPVMEVNSVLTGKRGVSLPFTDQCEPLGVDAQAAPKLLQAVLDLGSSRQWRHLDVHGGAGLFGSAPVSAEFFGHTLDLSPGQDALYRNVAGAVRQNLKRAQREDVQAHLDSSLEGLRTFYALHCRTRRKHGVPPQPFGFFQKIHEWVLRQGRGILVLAKRGRTPLAAALFLHFGRSAIYKFGASDERHQQLRANNAVMWEAIRYYADQSCAWLHFGRTSMANEGLRRFKLGWGAVESVIRYYSYDFRRRTFRVQGDASESSYNGVFRRLPLFLNRWAGRIAYRHMA